MRLIFRSDAPTVGPSFDLFIPAVTGSITTTGNVPVISSGIVSPSTGSLVTASIQPAVDPGSSETVTAGAVDALATSSDAVTLSVPVSITVPVGSLAITENSPSRGIGLLASSDAPTVQISHAVTTLKGSAAFSSSAPEISVVSLANHKPIMLVGSIATTGNAAGLAVQLDVGSPDALITAGKTPTVEVSTPAEPTIDSLAFSSSAPTVEISNVAFAPIIIITPFNPGTPILNRDAVPDANNRYEVCDQTNFKLKVRKGSQLQEQWDGLRVRADSFDGRHPQLDQKATKASRLRKGAMRPEPAEDTFIDSDNPVTQDDL
jgi:hypothetical protein